MRIFYLTDGRHSFGGQVVNLEHVLALRRFGYDARYLLLPPPGEPPRVHLPPGVVVPWQTDISDLASADFVVLGEMHGAAANLLAKSPARKLIHNQNLFYTFRAFRDLQVIRDWGCEGSHRGTPRVQSHRVEQPHQGGRALDRGALPHERREA